MYDSEIARVIQQSVKTAVAGSTLPSLKIKYLGRIFEVPDDQKYLEILWFPNNPKSGYWGNEKDYMGFFRLVLHWPNDDKGIYTPMEVLESIVTYYSKDLSLQNVKIYDNPNFTGMVESGKEILYPATIRYTCFRP